MVIEKPRGSNGIAQARINFRELNMSGSREMNLKIRVTNLDTRAEFVHSNVPLDHVEMIRLNPNLRVEVLGRSRGRGNNQPLENKNAQKDTRSSN